MGVTKGEGELANRIRVSGTVAQLTESMAMVKPDPKSPTSVPAMMIDSATQFGGMDLGRFLAVGMVVEGEFDTSALRFFPDLDTWTPSRFFAEHPEGTVVLGLVAKVSRQEADVRLHPTLSVVMKRDEVSSNPRDVVDHLWTSGDIVRVRVVRDPKGQLRLRATDVDDDEPAAEAPAAFVGGDPWLTVGHMNLIESTKEMWERERQEAEAFTTALGVLSARMQMDIDQLETVLGSIGTDTGEVPVVTTSTIAETPLSPRDKSLNEFSAKQIQRMIANYRVELGKLVEQNERLSAALAAKTRREADLSENNEELRKQLSAARQKYQETGKQLDSVLDGSVMTDRRNKFASAEEWISEEMRRFWIDSYTPADRQKYPLDKQPWRVLPSFVTTFQALTDDGMDKAIKTATHIVTGRNAIEHITEDHPLREADESSSPEVVRADGAVARRAYIESHTSQARRLHYWRLRDGSIELSRVGLHDDFTP